MVSQRSREEISASPQPRKPVQHHGSWVGFVSQQSYSTWVRGWKAKSWQMTCHVEIFRPYPYLRVNQRVTECHEERKVQWRGVDSIEECWITLWSERHTTATIFTHTKWRNTQGHVGVLGLTGMLSKTLATPIRMNLQWVGKDANKGFPAPMLFCREASELCRLCNRNQQEVRVGIFLFRY